MQHLPETHRLAAAQNSEIVIMPVPLQDTLQELMEESIEIHTKYDQEER